MFGNDRLLTIYLSALIVDLFYAIVMTGKGNLIVLIDTFLPAGLLAVLLQTASMRDLATLRALLQWGIAANSMLALCEAAAHASLVPLYLNDSEFHALIEEFRPTALYDHPLTGGVMTMIGFALPPARVWLRIPYMCLLAGAILAFGGRVAVAAAVISWIILVGLDLSRSVYRRDPYAAHMLLSILLFSVGGIAFLAGALYAGFAARLGGHLYWDPSAQVRLAQWHILGELNSSQLIFGAARSDLLSLLDSLWLNYGVEVIENFWLLMFASLGAAGFAIFLFGFACLLAWCWKRTDLRGRVLLISVVCVASASNSLGRKSTLLVGLVAAITCVPAIRRRERKAASGNAFLLSARGASTSLSS